MLTDISSLKDQLVTSRREGEQSRGRIAELESQLHLQQTVNVTDKEKQVEQLQSRVQDQTQQMTQLQQQFRTKCDECDALRKQHQQQQVQLQQLSAAASVVNDDDVIKNSAIYKQLLSSYNTTAQQVDTLQLALQQKSQAFESELEQRQQEVSESHELVSQLQQQLLEGENSLREQSMQLAELRDKQFLSGSGGRGATTTLDTGQGGDVSSDSSQK